MKVGLAAHRLGSNDKLLPGEVVSAHLDWWVGKTMRNGNDRRRKGRLSGPEASGLEPDPSLAQASWPPP
ncbi:hypothetical protein, partial [Mesorhizobium sp. M8A.F.Ca.ET.218.01.1.1]|uniref:hypothetical protein n=1 Tax=Mesorhizobium sp. M8A.F.Ca.ET.218.01.1.1 TaxID=2563971 RepID=UPI001AEF2C3E